MGKIIFTVIGQDGPRHDSGQIQLPTSNVGRNDRNITPYTSLETLENIETQLLDV